MFTCEQSWGMTETERVVSLIKEIECWRLGNWDGCCCSRFSIRNVDIEIACGKGSEQAVTISSPSLDYRGESDFALIMAEVVRQVTEQSGRGGHFKQIIKLE